MATAAYFRVWRLAHPVYRARQTKLKRERRSRMTTAERQQERGAYRPIVPVEPIPPLHCGSDLFVHAKSVARVNHGFKYLTHPFYDDLVSEIVLAFVEGRSPTAARGAFLAAEYEWRNKTLQVRDGLEPFNGRLIAQGDEP